MDFLAAPGWRRAGTCCQPLDKLLEVPPWGISQGSKAHVLPCAGHYRPSGGHVRLKAYTDEALQERLKQIMGKPCKH